MKRMRERYKTKLRLTRVLLRKDQFLFIKKLTPVAIPMAKIFAGATSRPIPRRNPRNRRSSRSAVDPPTIMYLINIIFPSYWDSSLLLLNSSTDTFDLAFILLGDDIARASFDLIINFRDIDPNDAKANHDTAANSQN